MPFIQEVEGRLSAYLKESLASVIERRCLDPEKLLNLVVLEEPAQREHGDFACNIAMALSKKLKAAPRVIGAEIIENFPLERARDLVERMELAGPGFINIHLRKGWLQSLLLSIEDEGESYGKNKLGRGKKVQVEFVSANPTGPLHVGHSRGAVVGDTLARILAYCGFEVEKEFYINNAGRQMELLGRSIYLRLREEQGEKVEFPPDCYQGEYIKSLAQRILEKYGDSLAIHSEQERESLCREIGYQELLKNIKEDLKNCGIRFDNWFSERQLYEDGVVDEVLNHLKRKKLLYDKDGATWFATSRFGDDKDRVVIKSDGEYTYFAADIAYHYHKIKRNYDWIIDVLGADHHGHIARMQAAVAAFGEDADLLTILIVQIVTLWRGKKKMAMSKRAGEFVTMREVIDEIGADAARYFYLIRSPESHMDFDLEAAKEQSTNNPVYYLQYAHARIFSLFKKAEAEGLAVLRPSEVDLKFLDHELEENLLRVLARFPLVVEESYERLSPHYLTVYGHQLAQAFHTFYNKCPVINAPRGVREARLALVWATRRTLKNLLGLLGISAPQKM